jgi:hypothetical protein
MIIARKIGNPIHLYIVNQIKPNRDKILANFLGMFLGQIYRKQKTFGIIFHFMACTSTLLSLPLDNTDC